jgi:AAA15 family ATPase/GTPase
MASKFFKAFNLFKGKVSPTIKSVKPTKDVKGSVKRTKSDEYVKRITTLDKAEGKIKSGKQMIKEGQKARKTMVDTKRAFQFKHSKGYHAIKPGDKPEVKYKGNVRQQKMGGGMMGRRFGYKGGKLVGKQSIIAKQAGDPKKIESVDFKVLQAKRKNKKKV